MLGLRLLYGSSCAMSGKQMSLVPTWGNFLESFEKFASLSTRDAVGIIREGYGMDRSLLILIDAISKASPVGSDLFIMRDIEMLLDSEPLSIDVLVSSLSPNYISDLLSANCQPIIYTLLPPPLKCGLGKVEATEFASKVEHKTGRIVLKDEFFRTLQISHLFLSGNPRRIEHLVKNGYRNERQIDRVSNRLKGIKQKYQIDATGFFLFVASFVANVSRVEGASLYPSSVSSEILEIVFDMTAYDQCLSEEMRRWLENGVTFITPTLNTVQKFLFAMLLSNFLSVITDLRPQERGKLKPKSTAAVLILTI